MAKKRKVLREPLEPPFEEDRRAAPRWPKYPPLEPTLPTPIEQMSDRDVALLRRMLKKFGRDVVAEAVKTVAPPRNVGRPRGIEKPYLVRAHLAALFDKLVEEHKNHRYPVRAAMRELFEIAGQPGGPDAFGRFERTTKRKLPDGRRDWKGELERVARREAYLRKLKNTRE